MKSNEATFLHSEMISKQEYEKSKIKRLSSQYTYKWKDLKIKINLKHHYDKQMYYITVIKVKNMIDMHRIVNENSNHK